MCNRTVTGSLVDTQYQLRGFILSILIFLEKSCSPLNEFVHSIPILSSECFKSREASKPVE